MALNLKMIEIWERIKNVCPFRGFNEKTKKTNFICQANERTFGPNPFKILMDISKLESLRMFNYPIIRQYQSILERINHCFPIWPSKFSSDPISTSLLSDFVFVCFLDNPKKGLKAKVGLIWRIE